MAIDEKRLDRIEDKVDNIVDKLQETNLILAAQHESLKVHMKRSDNLEKIVVPMRQRMDRVVGAMQLIAMIAAIATIIEVLRGLH